MSIAIARVHGELDLTAGYRICGTRVSSEVGMDEGHADVGWDGIRSRYIRQYVGLKLSDFCGLNVKTLIAWLSMEH